MKGYVVAEEIGEISEVPDNSQIIFWSKRNKWMVIKMPKSTGMKRRLLEMATGKPKRLLVRMYDPDPISRDIQTYDFPLVASQWETAALRGWVDNQEQILDFRVINWRGEPLNLAVIVIGRAVYSPGDSIRLTADWGKQDDMVLIKKGTKGIIYAVNEDGKSYSVRTEKGIFGWLEDSCFRRTVLGI